MYLVYCVIALQIEGKANALRRRGEAKDVSDRGRCGSCGAAQFHPGPQVPIQCRLSEVFGNKGSKGKAGVRGDANRFQSICSS